jgi:hypothetical protein
VAFVTPSLLPRRVPRIRPGRDIVQNALCPAAALNAESVRRAPDENQQASQADKRANFEKLDHAANSRLIATIKLFPLI